MADEKEPQDPASNEEQAAPPTDAAAPAEKPEQASEPKPEEAKPGGDTAAAKPPEEGGRKEPEKKKDIFLEIDGGEEEKPKIIKAKGSKHIHSGIVHIHSTFNNTKVSVTDMRGNLIGWSSAGKLGFKGSRKSTAYAAQLVSQDACRQAMGHGLKEAQVRVKGPGSGRESAVRAVQALGIEVTLIKDVTPIPHNGCRPPKARRV